MISLLLLLFATNYALTQSESYETAVAKEDVKCSGMGAGSCKPGNRVKPEMLWQRQEDYARGVPRYIDPAGCRRLCEQAGPLYGPGCCYHGALYKNDNEFDAKDDDPMWVFTGRGTVQSCFYFKEGDFDMSYSMRSFYRKQEYRMVCKKPSDWAACTEHKDCSGDMFCQDNACLHRVTGRLAPSTKTAVETCFVRTMPVSLARSVADVAMALEILVEVASQFTSVVVEVPKRRHSWFMIRIHHQLS